MNGLTCATFGRTLSEIWDRKMKEHIKEIYSGVRCFQVGNKRLTMEEIFECMIKMESEKREYEAANQEQVRQVV